MPNNGTIQIQTNTHTHTHITRQKTHSKEMPRNRIRFNVLQAALILSIRNSMGPNNCGHLSTIQRTTKMCSCVFVANDKCWFRFGNRTTWARIYKGDVICCFFTLFKISITHENIPKLHMLSSTRYTNNVIQVRGVKNNEKESQQKSKRMCSYVSEN